MLCRFSSFFYLVICTGKIINLEYGDIGSFCVLSKK